ncbi:MAG: hypothetical protein OXF45_02210 [Candidatus Dadabacteria bacterium]|nr:hypothetical protein [Candidatus Dadabacteria bacterium]
MFKVQTDAPEAIKWFRRVLLCEIIFIVLAVMAELTLIGTLPRELQRFVQKQPTGSEVLVAGFAFLVLLPLVIVAIVGAWKLKSWARKLYVVMFVLGSIMILLSGPTVTSSWGEFFYTLAAYLDSVVIFMMFFVSPIKEQFQGKSE